MGVRAVFIDGGARVPDSRYERDGLSGKRIRLLPPTVPYAVVVFRATVGVYTSKIYAESDPKGPEAIRMAMSKKDKTKKEQQLKKEAAELKARADAGDKEAKRELEKVNKKLKK